MTDVGPDAGLLAKLQVEDLALPPTEVMNDVETPFIVGTTLRQGESVSALLNRLGVRDAEARNFITSRGSALLHLKPGAAVVAHTSRPGGLQLLDIFDYQDTKSVRIKREAHGLAMEEQTIAPETRVASISGTIRSNFSAAANAAGLPADVLRAAPAVLGEESDALGKLKRGDRFGVIYEALFHQGVPYRSGRILALELTHAAHTHTAYWFSKPGNKGSYYSEDGKNLSERFLHSPVAASRISSGFVGREHPVLKTWIQHKGIDFSAPLGTPVHATADGVVEFIGDMRGFGNFITLRHDKAITTAYGHLDGFAEALKKGDAVRQGEVIGFVGQTGWATGAHLHYEFRINGVHQNPLEPNLASALPPDSHQLARFHAQVTKLRAPLASGAKATLALLN
ncbi:M23 family metallopeptidase [Uliginosibacterium sp. H3]|uniref:M23 family metallopeptidase n=1 Tax=Uliginosibacterium silvisoli TaxID=3114758 RepID=A0ABU6K4P3_9RHOO|nr:M23 family metallopeptidase [Uliginosibacterium sp. H3]